MTLRVCKCALQERPRMNGSGKHSPHASMAHEKTLDKTMEAELEASSLLFGGGVQHRFNSLTISQNCKAINKQCKPNQPFQLLQCWRLCDPQQEIANCGRSWQDPLVTVKYHKNAYSILWSYSSWLGHVKPPFDPTWKRLLMVSRTRKKNHEAT
jgi:hypothetical protein